MSLETNASVPFSRWQEGAVCERSVCNQRETPMTFLAVLIIHCRVLGLEMEQFPNQAVIQLLRMLSIESSEDGWWELGIPQLPQEVETLLGLVLRDQGCISQKHCKLSSS